jgi:DNA-binding Xre family transcriptional regulator
MVDSDKVSEINLKRLIRSCEKLGAQSGGVLERDTKRTFVKVLP